MSLKTKIGLGRYFFLTWLFFLLKICLVYSTFSIKIFLGESNMLPPFKYMKRDHMVSANLLYLLWVWAYFVSPWHPWKSRMHHSIRNASRPSYILVVAFSSCSSFFPERLLSSFWLWHNILAHCAPCRLSSLRSEIQDFTPIHLIPVAFSN